MTTDQIQILALLAVLLGLFIWNRFRFDLVALAGLMAAVVLGLIPAQEAFLGFGHPATITVAAVLILSRSLSISGAMDWLSGLVTRLAGGPRAQIASLSGTAGVLSAFMNNVGALAMLLPVALQTCRKVGRAPRLVLMPVAFGSILGGLVTLISTPPNILVATYRHDATGTAFGMFDFSLVGLPVALAGLAFVVLIGWRLIPRGDEGDGGERDLFRVEPYISELRIPKDSKAHGRSLAEIETMTKELDVAVIGMIRRGTRYPVAPRHEPLKGTDTLIVEAEPEELDRFVSALGIKVAGTGVDKARLVQSEDAAIAEAVVLPGARIEGRTIGAMRLRDRFRLTLLGVSRQGRPYRGRLSSFRVQAGDILLVQGLSDDIPDALGRLGCLPLAGRDIQFGKRRSALIAAGLFAAAVALAAAGLLPIHVAFCIAVIGVVALNIVSLRDVYAAVDWPVIVLLGSLIPVGGAMETTGTTVLIADAILAGTSDFPPWVIVALLLIVTMTLSDVLNNAATTVVMAPIAFGVAQRLGAAPDPFLMAVAIGASCAFLTPIGHQNNALVMGPGGYRFGDYWRMGLPLEVLICAVAVPLILVMWPL